jgi:hypothetical protein
LPALLTMSAPAEVAAISPIGESPLMPDPA